MTFDDVKNDPSLLHELLSYDPDTGKLFWKEREGDKSFNNQYAGKEALACALPSGHLVGGLLLKTGVTAHHVIWAMATGKWAEGQLDHKNGNPSNNRLDNLREATHSQNMMNRKKLPDCSSEHVGVRFDGRRGVWRASIQSGGQRFELGCFESEELAIKARHEAAEELHGEFAAHLREAA